MPIDFLSDDMDKTHAQNAMNGRDYLMEEEPEPESLGKAAAYAIPRIATDVAKSGYEFLKKIPDYLESGKTEVPGLYNLAKEHPLHALTQAGAGAAELGHNLLSLPKGLADYASKRLNLLPNEIAESTWHPSDSSLQNIKDYFGEPIYPGESLVRGAVRNLPEIAGGKRMASALNPMNYGAKEISKIILKKHDELDKAASRGFSKVLKKVNQRGISEVPIKSELIDSLYEYFPKTKAAQKLLDNAKTGNYGALRKIQSDLYTRGKDAIKSPLIAEKDKGAEILEMRDNINQAISQHLQNTGNHDLDKLLNNSRQKYRKLQEIYYNPKMSNAIQDMVDTETRKIPSNLPEVLRENSKPMSKLKDFHPGLNNALRAQKISSLLRKLTLPALAGAFGAHEENKYFNKDNE